MSLQLKMANYLPAAQSHAGSSPTGSFCCKFSLDLSVNYIKRQRGDGVCRSFTLGFWLNLFLHKSQNSMKVTVIYISLKD